SGVDAFAAMKLGSSRGMDTKPPPRSERSKPRHELQLTRPSQPPYPWPPEQAQAGVSKPCRTTSRGRRRCCRRLRSGPLAPARVYLRNTDFLIRGHAASHLE